MSRVDPELLVYEVTANTRGLPGHMRESQAGREAFSTLFCSSCDGDGCLHCDFTGDAT